MFGYCPSLQPYQGRNPCMERNLMVPHDGDSNSGELIDKSHKHITNISVPAQAPLPSEYLNVPPAPQPPPRPSVPIPFLQNVNSEPTQPKMSNVVAGAGRKSTWKRIRQVLSGGRDQAGEILINHESAINVSTPIEEKLPTKVSEMLYFTGHLMFWKYFVRRILFRIFRELSYFLFNIAFCICI